MQTNADKLTSVISVYSLTYMYLACTLSFLSCLNVMLNEIELGPNIARNQALKENIFMMVVCIENRIPLFLVGKPGSSKSLAKTIVADAMQGNAAKSDLFRTFKAVSEHDKLC